MFADVLLTGGFSVVVLKHMQKGDFKGRGKKAMDGGTHTEEKICPFISSPKELAPCTPQCKLYRGNKGNYNCYFMEMQAISYNTRERKNY